MAHLLLFGLIFIAVQTVAAQGIEEPTIGSQGGRFGIGFASSWPAYGISGTMRISEAITGEAVLGFFGAISNFGGRAWYRFNRNQNYDLYGYGAVSLYRYGYTEFVGPTLSTRRATESVLGLGGGAGIESGIQTLFKDDSLPPIFLNWEIGIAMANFDRYNFSSFVYGGGIHYRFGGQ
jgi:hypothetical protein